jgi:hypothetical protein
VTLPALQPLLGGSLSCGNVDGFIDLTFPGLTCIPPTISVPFSYHNDPPTVTNASPKSLSQDGSLFPATGSPTTVTLTGTNFASPMTVQLLAGSSPVAGANLVLANVSSPTALTFTAPPVPDAAFLKEACVPTGGTSFTGQRLVSTVFGVRVQNSVTRCSYDLPNVLTYSPLDTTCKGPLQIVTSSLPNGKVGVAYNAAQVFATGGAGPPYTWTATGLPAAIVLDPLTGVFSGAPATAGTFTVQINVVDSAAATANRLYTLQVAP